MDISGSMQGAGGVGGLLCVDDQVDTFYPTYDGNGNVSEYLDASGNDVAHYEYDAFGNTTFSQGTKKDHFSHRFSTKYLDGESGLYYYGYRYYDPVTGRWPSRDPIGVRGGFNLYGMVGNNAINFMDYLGLDPVGHHVVSQSLWKSHNLVPEARFVFDNTRLTSSYYNFHDYSARVHISHGEYNKSVKTLLDDFLLDNKVAKLADLTGDQAKSFVKFIENLPPDHDISRFNKAIRKEISIAEASARFLKKTILLGAKIP